MSSGNSAASGPCCPTHASCLIPAHPPGPHLPLSSCTAPATAYESTTPAPEPEFPASDQADRSESSSAHSPDCPSAPLPLRPKMQEIEPTSSPSKLRFHAVPPYLRLQPRKIKQQQCNRLPSRRVATWRKHLCAHLPPPASKQKSAAAIASMALRSVLMYGKLLGCFFGLHRNGNVCRYLPVQLHRNVELTHLFQRLVQMHLAAVDVEALCLQMCGDVSRRHRAEQVVILAHLALEDQHKTVQLSYQRFCLGLLLGRLAHCRSLHVFNLLAIGRGCLHGKLFRQQIIAAVTVGHLHHVAAVAQVVDVFFQNHFHCESPVYVAPAQHGRTTGADFSSGDVAAAAQSLISRCLVTGRERQQRDVARLL